MESFVVQNLRQGLECFVAELSLGYGILKIESFFTSLLQFLFLPRSISTLCAFFSSINTHPSQVPASWPDKITHRWSVLRKAAIYGSLISEWCSLDRLCLSISLIDKMFM
jgi:hypothetical protein